MGPAALFPVAMPLSPLPPSPHSRWFLVRWGLPLAVLLFVPHVFSHPGEWEEPERRVRFGWPRTLAGDEPHYLVQLHSLLSDGDLDVSDDYAEVHAGGDAAGRHFRGQPIDHHSVWFTDGERVGWHDTYFPDASQWRREPDGRWVPTLRPDREPGAAEYSTHPPGMAIVAAAFLWPLRGTEAVEPGTLVLGGLATLLAAVCFLRLVRAYVEHDWQAGLVTLVAFLGTPAWLYGRTFYNEPYLLLLTTFAYMTFLRDGQRVLAGTAIAIGMLVKPPFGLLLVPMLLAVPETGRWRHVLMLSLPCVVGAGVVLGLNTMMFGGPLRSSQPFQWGNPLWNGLLLVISPQNGVLPFAPVVLPALVLWPRFVREYGRDAIVLGLGFLLYFGLMACWKYWHGGFCYGPRLVVPVLPLALVPLALAFRTTGGRIAFGLFGLLGVAINLIAVTPPWSSWTRHPFSIAGAWVGTWFGS